MCRWFAYISATEPCLLEDVLITPEHSLVKQVNEHFLPGLNPHPRKPAKDPLVNARNSSINIDGLGVAWYTSSAADFELGDTGKSSDGTQKEGLRPAAYKTIAPPIHDLNFRSICANTETKVCFGHIRAASGTPIVHVNNHPFIFGRHTCMHNGYITGFDIIRRAMCAKMSDAAYNAMLGSTDSEHLFALYMTYLTSHGDSTTWEQTYPVESMASALHDAVATIISLQISLIGPSNITPNSLNLCVTDGIKLVAYRFRNHHCQEPPSLYYSTKAGTTLNRKYPDHPDGGSRRDKDQNRPRPTRWSTSPPRIAARLASDADNGDKDKKPPREHGKHVIVASEPSTYKECDWHLIGRNQFLIADHHADVRIHDIPYDGAWNAVDPEHPE